MNNVFASIQRESLVTNGAGLTGFKYNSILVGGAGDIAISRDGGLTFFVYPTSVVPVGGVFNVAGNAIGTAAQGTTATDLIAASWGSTK